MILDRLGRFLVWIANIRWMRFIFAEDLIKKSQFKIKKQWNTGKVNVTM